MKTTPYTTTAIPSEHPLAKLWHDRGQFSRQTLLRNGNWPILGTDTVIFLHFLNDRHADIAPHQAIPLERKQYFFETLVKCPILVIFWATS